MQKKQIAFSLLILAAPALTANSSYEAPPEPVLAAIERAVDDLLLRMEINIQLREDAELAQARVEADIKGGIVTLTGYAIDDRIMDRAVRLAHRIDGVTAVHTRFER